MSVAREVLDRLPLGPVVRCGSHETKGPELRRRCEGLCAWLRDHGVSPGTRVAVLVPGAADFVTSVLGLVMAGAVPVLVEPGQPGELFQARMAAAEVQAVLVDPRLHWAWRIPGLPALLRRRGKWIPPRPEGPVTLVLPARTPRRWSGVERAETDDALIVFTGGTTDAPRAVVHTHGSLSHFLAGAGRVVQGLATTTYLAELPQQLFYGLISGSICILPQGKRSAAGTLKAMRQHQPECWFGSPWTMQQWLDQGEKLPDSLKTVVLASAPVTSTFLSRLQGMLPAHTRVRCLYGLTEVGPVALVDASDKVGHTGEGDLVGVPVEGVEVRVRRDQVQVRSPAMAQRYLGQPPLGEWLETGDLGRVGAEGLVLHGRAKDMIIREGVNLYPGLYEPLLARTFHEAVLIGVFDGQRQDERVVLAHVGEAPAGLTELLGAAAPDHLLPLEALPRTGRQHKVDRKALRELARESLGIPA